MKEGMKNCTKECMKNRVKKGMKEFCSKMNTKKFTQKSTQKSIHFSILVAKFFHTLNLGSGALCQQSIHIAPFGKENAERMGQICARDQCGSGGRVCVAVAQGKPRRAAQGLVNELHKPHM